MTLRSKYNFFSSSLHYINWDLFNFSFFILYATINFVWQHIKKNYIYTYYFFCFIFKFDYP